VVTDEVSNDEQGRFVVLEGPDLTTNARRWIENNGRNYFEFILVKPKQFARVGPLIVSLRKSNSKHQYYDLPRVVDDRQLSRKQVSQYEPTADLSP
jgi:hypothetical protein